MSQGSLCLHRDKTWRKCAKLIIANLYIFFCDSYTKLNWMSYVGLSSPSFLTLYIKPIYFFKF